MKHPVRMGSTVQWVILVRRGIAPDLSWIAPISFEVRANLGHVLKQPKGVMRPRSPMVPHVTMASFVQPLIRALTVSATERG